MTEASDAPKPTPLQNPDLSGLAEFVKSGVAEVAKGKGGFKDFDHLIFESALEAVYGPEIWTWWNDQYVRGAADFAAAVN